MEGFAIVFALGSFRQQQPDVRFFFAVLKCQQHITDSSNE